MASLTRFTSLRRATFELCALPGSLSELTGLQVLDINCPKEAAVASLAAALPRLTQLTGLRLEGLPAAATASASIAALTRLHWIYLWPMTALRREAAVAEDALPLGPWQRSLRHLMTTFLLAQRNLRFLSGAEQLQRLSFLQPPAPPAGAEAQWHAFWRWAEKHPPLQSIGFEAEEAVDTPLVEAMLQLQARRPALLIDTRLEVHSLCREHYSDVSSD